MSDEHYPDEDLGDDFYEDESPVDPPTPAPAPSKDWTEDQKRALEALERWSVTPGGAKYTALLGLAGTGKTTVATELIARLQSHGLSTIVCAPTGKAASVLRRKGAEHARTLHSAIYELDESRSTPDNMVWKVRQDARRATLAIVDEASMLTVEMLNDLAGVVKRILLVGDPGQLPPVGGEPALAQGMPRHVLTTIHRQAQDSGIVRFAHAVRSRMSIKEALREGGKDVVQGLAPDPEQVGIILCATNAQRMSSNSEARLMRGFRGSLPNEGETLMCLKNRRDGWCNGMTCKVLEIKELDDERAFLRAECDDGQERDSIIWREQLTSPKMLNWRDAPWGAEPFTYGYAATVHKAQGSEWGQVELVETWPMRQGEEETRRRWLYTAITRAKTRLHWAA